MGVYNTASEHFSFIQYSPDKSFVMRSSMLISTRVIMAMNTTIIRYLQKSSVSGPKEPNYLAIRVILILFLNPGWQRSLKMSLTC